jgi:hypothetical protein
MRSSPRGSQHPLPRLLLAADNAAMPTEPPKVNPPKRERRWCQFSLRTLLIFTVTIAVGAGWLGKRIEQKRKDRETVEAIVKLGGTVAYDYQTDDLRAEPRGPSWLRDVLGENFFSEVDGVWLRNATDVDAGVAHLKGLTQLRVLNLWNTKASDVTLLHLKELPELQELNLDGTNVTDTGLLNLKGLTQLQGLSLARTNVSDTGLASLKGLTQLRLLIIDNTTIGDAGLESLKGLTQLHTLILVHTQVSDDGLENLKALTQLQELDLSFTNVTDAGVKGLQKSLSNCTIKR